MKRLFFIVIYAMFFSLVAMDNDKLQLNFYMRERTEKEKNELKNSYIELMVQRAMKSLQGSDLIGPLDVSSPVEDYNILKQLVLLGLPDVLPVFIEFDKTLINSDGAYEAIYSSLFDNPPNNIESFTYFIESGADVNHKIEGETFLALACKKNSPMITLLLINNANPNIQNASGFTALHESVRLSFYEDKKSEIVHNIRQLIVSGAHPDIATFEYHAKPRWESKSKYDGKAAIEIADIMCRKDLAKLIQATVNKRTYLFNSVKLGSNISFTNINYISRRHARDIYGSSLLYYALKYKNRALGKKLIKLWPELLNQANFYNKTVLDLLPVECCKLLLDVPEK